MEKAIDDLAWTGTMDRLFRVDEFEQFMDKIPWYAKPQFSHEDVSNYSDLKSREHFLIVEKLMKIRDFISDQGMRSSLDPLIAHHSKLGRSYSNIQFASLILNIRAR
jgi:hypothetical protein